MTSRSRSSASLSGCLTYPTCAFKSPPTTTQHRDGAAFTILSAQSYILSVAQSPIGGRVEPHQQKIEFRRFDPDRSSSHVHTCIWRGHFADLPNFAKVKPDGNNEPRVSIRPPSRPITPLEQSVSSKHTVCHGRAVSAWPFGTSQEDHVIRQKGE